MDQKELVKWGLIALGAYLIYKYIEDNGGLSAVLGTGATTTATTNPLTPNTGTITSGSTTTAQIAAQNQANALNAAGAASKAAASNVASNAATTPPATTAAGCPIGQVLVNGVCTTEPAGATLISQQMLNAATAAGEPNNLDMDQWDYYYQMVTGNAFPVDPGSIAPGVYVGAGIVDRTTPTDIGTWLAIMQNQAPQLGLSGMSAFSIPRFTPPWMVM
jgi:hypothetical protein